MQTLLNKSIYFLIVAVAILGAFAIVTFAQTATTTTAQSSISFPIVELGGCANKEACRAYCGVEENHAACEAFATAHGLKAAKPLRDIQGVIASDGGPGGCGRDAENPQDTCKKYCSEASHVNECVAYAKEHGLMTGKRLEEAQGVAKAIKDGSKLPDGCKDQESCKEVCENPPNTTVARQCFNFAVKAGILPPGVDKEKAEKLFTLIEDGKGLFKTFKELNQCRNTADQDTREKCIAFAEENNLIPPQELDILKKTGGQGPGGCQGRDECQLYCKDHQNECYTFAKEHNLINPNDSSRIEEGLMRLKQNLANAPEKVHACLAVAVGQDAINAVMGGTTPPPPEFGMAMKKCVETAMQENAGFGGPLQQFFRPNASGTPDIKNLPPKTLPPGARALPVRVRACVVEKVGEERVAAIEKSTTEIDESLRQIVNECFKQVQVMLPPPNGGGMSSSSGERINPPSTMPMPCRSAAECKQFCSEVQNAPTELCKKILNYFTEHPNATTLPPLPGSGGTTSGTMPRMCTQEAKMCADGTYVGRVGPNCEFARCPGDLAKPPAGTMPIMFGTTTMTPEMKERMILEQQMRMQQAGPTGTSTKPPMPTMLPPAGAPCTSLEACKVFCSNPLNTTKEVCIYLMRSTNAASGTALPSANFPATMTPPTTGGVPCNSLESCRMFCSSPMNQSREICVRLIGSLNEEGQTLGPNGSIVPIPQSQIDAWNGETGSTPTPPPASTSQLLNPFQQFASVFLSLFFH